MRLQSRADLASFVQSLRVPEERRACVQLELEDHAFGRMAELEAAGVSTLEAERLAFDELGETAALRRSLEPVESAFSFTYREAAARGLRWGATMLAVQIAGFVFTTQDGFLLSVFAIGNLALGCTVFPRSFQVRARLGERRAADVFVLCTLIPPLVPTLVASAGTFGFGLAGDMVVRAWVLGFMCFTFTCWTYIGLLLADLFRMPGAERPRGLFARWS